MSWIEFLRRKKGVYEGTSYKRPAVGDASRGLVNEFQKSLKDAKIEDERQLLAKQQSEEEEQEAKRLELEKIGLARKEYVHSYLDPLKETADLLMEDLASLQWGNEFKYDGSRAFEYPLHITGSTPKAKDLERKDLLASWIAMGNFSRNTSGQCYDYYFVHLTVFHEELSFETNRGKEPGTIEGLRALLAQEYVKGPIRMEAEASFRERGG